MAQLDRFIFSALLAVAIAASVIPVRSHAQEHEVPRNPLEGRSDVLDEGRSLFNQYCSHCHGPNAVQGERPRDLRRLKIRYADKAPEVFENTLATGRPEKGMPVWKGVLSDDVIWRIYTYLDSVQTKP